MPESLHFKLEAFLSNHSYAHAVVEGFLKRNNIKMQGLHVHNQDDYKFTKEFSVTGVKSLHFGRYSFAFFLTQPNVYLHYVQKKRE